VRRRRRAWTRAPSPAGSARSGGAPIPQKLGISTCRTRVAGRRFVIVGSRFVRNRRLHDRAPDQSRTSRSSPHSYPLLRVVQKYEPGYPAPDDGGGRGMGRSPLRETIQAIIDAATADDPRRLQAKVFGTPGEVQNLEPIDAVRLSLRMLQGLQDAALRLAEEVDELRARIDGQ
jgi:hypothetical protein